MTEEEAKRQLRRMLRSFTPGSVLHLLSQLFRESAARSGRKKLVRQRRRHVAATLFVVGLGVDAACPR
jgi:hypothetical protein